jgi:Concanavalin A-like lectin/glucanases superfamily
VKERESIEDIETFSANAGVVLMRSQIAMGVASLCLAVVVAAPAQAATPAALWHMNEPPGSRMVDATGRNYGIPRGAVVQGVPWGVSRTAYRFRGPRALVDVLDNNSLDPGSRKIRLIAHVRFTAAPLNRHDYDLVRKGLGSTSTYYKMEIKTINSKPQVLCLFQGSKARAMKTSGRRTPHLANGRWHRLACVKTDSYVRVFIDGVAFGKKRHAAGWISNGHHVLIGARTRHGGDQYHGVMDEVEIDIGRS